MQLEKMQACELNILKEIAKICNSHNLKWFAIGGTMLGAVRHGGFIPWDDDIDIGMPRKDYELFLKYAKDELPDHMQVLTSAGSTPLLFAKVHDVTTTFIESSCKNKPNWYRGIYVDIMPFDGMPKNRVLKNFYCFFLKNVVKLYHLKNFGKNFHISLKTILIKLYPLKLMCAFRNRLIKHWDFYTSDSTCFTWSIRSKKLTFKTALFNNTVEQEFEDFSIPIPESYHEYLTIHYGDYMKLPPEKERHCHSADSVIDLTKSYTAYM